ncbi:MAG: hypothetical protein IPK50_05205 [Fibrobacterota bacterium]|nr:hypothetical protein [Fibrobacterota bacterium]QQS06291.1 MAG: hypothetical protein IPK50_05205 [Fibrobacterota bacterium]
MTLLLALQSLASANLGDWKLWTTIKTAHNAVVRDQSVLIATGGGVVEWSASRTKQKLYTTLDGLPEINTVSVIADGTGSIWAVGSTGRLARLGPGASIWEATGSYAASSWTFNTAATTYWKGFLILGGDQGLSLFSTSAKVAMDNISSIQGKTVKFSSALVVNDTLWVGTDKGTAYCAPDQGGWEKAGTPGHYLTDPARWHWVNDIADQIILRSVETAVFVNSGGIWADGIRNFATDGQRFVWKGGQVFISGASHAVEAPGGGFIVSSSSVGPAYVKPDGSWKPLEVEGAFPFHPLPVSVAIDANGGLYALGQSILNLSVLARRPPGTYNWNLDTIQFKAPDSTGTQVTIFPWWDPGETKRRTRLGLDVEQNGRIAIAAWASSLGTTGIYLSSQANNWTRIHYKIDTCLQELTPGGASIGSALQAIRAREDGLWSSELIPSEASSNLPVRIHHLPKGSNGPLSCLDLPFVTSEFQTFDILPSSKDLWLATSEGLKRVANFQQAFAGSKIAPLTSPVGATANTFVRLERYPLGGKDWIIGAGEASLGLVDPSIDTFYAVTNGADQSYRALAVDSKNQIWAAGNSGIDIFQVSLQQDTNGTVAPAFEKIRRITRVDGLPESEILDMQLDSASGRALITTANALVLWASPFRPVTKKLDPAKVKVWPNPMRLSQVRTLFVDGVTEQAEFSLLAQDGTLVYHLASGRQTSGMFQLELPPAKNLRPGLYFWAVKDGNTVARGPLLIGY